MVESKNTMDSPSDARAAGLSLNDIYFVIFRRKWLILLGCLGGMTAAAVLYLRFKPVYRSDSKLLVRYVLENKSPMPPGDNSQVRQPDSGGTTILASEIEILTSLDLFVHVADAVGPAKILQGMGETDDKNLAAAMIAKGITPEVPPKSNIIKVTFRHPDPEVVTVVLEKLIDEYLKRHAEIHRGLGSLDDVLSREADQLKAQLNHTEEELRKLKAKVGVIDLEGTKKAYIEEMSNLRRELFNTEADLAEARAAVNGAPANAGVTNALSKNATNALEPEVPADILSQYRELVSRLGFLRNDLFVKESQFSDENPVVKRVREHVTEIDQQRKDLETAHPALLKVRVAVSTAEGFRPELERYRPAALEAKVSAISNRLEGVRAEVAKMDEVETEIKQLQRKRDLEEANYRYFAAGLERSHFDERLGSTRHRNISVVQRPTPAWKDSTKRLKMAGAVLAAGLGGGIALAFLLEIFLDQTLRRPHEVGRRLQIPLFMAIPYVNGKATRMLAKARKKRAAAGGEDTALPPATAWELSHPLRPMFEGLRDRMAHHFRNVAHKPKLIGVSTCSDAAGATTVAAGLAAALSDTGEGKVLLVDLNSPKGAAHPFSQGKPACEIIDALEDEKREAGLVQENLYMALARTVSDRRLGLLAKQLSVLVPKFKASDYDYIIFDMPRISATSPSLRLAGMMDLTLLVIEAEKVSREAVKQGYSLLADTGAQTQIILNKVRNYIPARLSGEL